MSGKYRITYWRHIPAMVVVSGADGRTVKMELPKRFMNSIDAYAMAVGLTSSDDYSAQWKKGPWIECEGDPDEIARAVCAELESEFKYIDIPKRNSRAA